MWCHDFGWHFAQIVAVRLSWTILDWLASCRPCLLDATSLRWEDDELGEVECTLEGRNSGLAWWRWICVDRLIPGKWRSQCLVDSPRSCCCCWCDEVKPWPTIICSFPSLVPMVLRALSVLACPEISSRVALGVSRTSNNRHESSSRYNSRPGY